MAQPTNTFDTYDAKGIREDLLNNIFTVDPDEIPFLGKIAKTKAASTFHEWQTDQLDTPSDSNAAIEGDDVVGGAVSPTVRLGNYTQIFTKPVVIPDTLEATTRAGRGREMAYQMLMKARAMKTDMEKSAFANQARVAGSSVLARRLAGVPVWLTSNTSAGGGGGADATGDGTDARTDGTQRAFTEALLRTVLKDVYENSNLAPDCAFMSATDKMIASGFDGASSISREQDTSSGKLVTAINVYEYDFGILRFEPSRHVRDRDVLVLNTSMWAWAELRPMAQKRLAKTGDSEKEFLVTEATLVCRNEKASGGVFDTGG